MKITNVFLSAILPTVLCFSGNLLAYSGDGDGTAENPYQISSVGDWQELMASPGDWSSSFILTADINLAGVTLTPVGNESTLFTGVFNGNDNVISNAEINLPSSDRVGLFGRIGSSGQIHDLGVEDVNMSGYYSVGGLVGSNEGKVTACYATGSVTGGEDLSTGGLMGVNSGTVTACYATGSVSGYAQVGGLVGCNVGTLIGCYATGSASGNERVGGLVGWNGPVSITNCYATGSVSGNEKVGGLVGQNFEGTVTDCYATGSVSGIDYVGGLMGYQYIGTVIDCFWDIETSGQTTSMGGTGKTTVEMKTLSTFTSAGWDFVNETVNGTNDIWTINENVDYPKHVWSLANFNGDGTPENPYQIGSVEDWQLLMASPGAWSRYFILTTEINLAGVTLTPVGNSTTQFTGVFDGNDNVISSARLFGYVGVNGQIHDLGIEDINVTGEDYVGGFMRKNSGTLIRCHTNSSVSGSFTVGGLVAENYGMLIGCYTTGSVSGMDYVGGLVGDNYGTLTGCYTTGSVTGEGYVIGGLVGWNVGTVTDCYAIGSVSGHTLVGGLAGEGGGTVTGCYATGSVTGEYANIGGLMGSNGGTVKACYATGSASGLYVVGGLVGRNFEGTVTDCYATGSVSGNERVGGLMGYQYIGTVIDCFWDIETSGQTTSDGGTGKTTVEMKTLSTFTSAGWDFVNETVNGTNDIWTINENVDYPKHVWSIANFNGDGTPENPYQISSVEDWQELMASPINWSSSFILTTDINLAGVTLTPVGNSTTQFTGVFDGNDNIISNALINQPSSYRIGLFGYVGGGSQIHDLGVVDVNMIGGYQWVGGLVAINGYHNIDGGSITSCYVTGSVSSNIASSEVGGLVGWNRGSITDCYTNCSVSGNDDVGGLVGANADGIITDCYTNGSVFGGFAAGGLVGANGGTVTDCYATGSVSQRQYIGGLVGWNEGTVTGCYATGSVSGDMIVGGLVAYNGGSGTLTDCYATGSVSGDLGVGGLICSNNGTVTDCFWDIENTGQTTSDGGTGKSTVEMKTLSTFTFAGWDFVNETVNGTDDIWTINENVDYPKHVWSLVNFIGSSEVDFADYSFFAKQWLKTNCGTSNDCNGADFDFSDAVDDNDLKIFTDHWLQ